MDFYLNVSYKMQWLIWWDFFIALYGVLVLLKKCALSIQMSSGQVTRVLTPILTSSAALSKSLISCLCFDIYKTSIVIYWASPEYNEV